MWRKTISSGAAALAAWIIGTSSAGAHSWPFGLHHWPHLPTWGEPKLVGEGTISVPGVNDGCPIETADGLSLFIASNRNSEPNDIWVADRTSIAGPWGAPQVLEANVLEPLINLKGVADFCPTPVRGRSLMFVSTRAGGCAGEQTPGGGDMYISRQSPAGAWAAPVHLGCAPQGPNTAGGERSPSLVETPYGTFLFYSTNGNTETGGFGPNQSIHVSVMRSNGTFGPGKPIAALNVAGVDDIMPNVRERPEGGYEMVFSSNRGTSLFGGAPKGAQDVYMSFAWFLPGPWSPPVNLGGKINTDGVEQRATLSHDGKRLYFGRVPAGTGQTSDVYVSERVLDRKHK